MAQLSSAPKQDWQYRLTRSVYFLAAVLLHLIVFLMISTWIVFKAPPAPETASFLAVSTQPKPPPPPAPPPPSGGTAANPLEAAAQATPPSSPTSVIVSSIPSNFGLKSVKVAMPNLPASFTQPQGTDLSGQAMPGLSQGAGSPFGSPNQNGTQQFVGYLYDLKQSPSGNPTGLDAGGLHEKMKALIASNWSPNILSPYYKSPTPLNTSSIFVPTINAEDGPKAFGVEKEVKPNVYIVWYKVTASPTQDGTYHFVGAGDDILLVRVNHKMELDGSGRPIWANQAKAQKYCMTNFNPTWEGNANFWIGEPFHVSAGEPVDIDVIIGEEPGGRSNYFLFLQRDESTYQKQSNGTPLLPIFQLDSTPIKPVGAPGTFPPFSSTPEPWQAVSK